VPVGGTVRFTNSDALLHNVLSTSMHEGLNKVATKNVAIEKTYQTIGVHHLKCDFHAWMSAYVFVTEHAYTTVTSADGRFELDVPPGSYELVVWHEKLGELTGTAHAGKPVTLEYPTSRLLLPEARTTGPAEW
jgi:hypothetical protein